MTDFGNTPNQKVYNFQLSEIGRRSLGEVWQAYDSFIDKCCGKSFGWRILQ